MYNIGRYIGRNPDYRLFEKSNTLINNDIDVGIEIEIENIRYFESLDGYPKVFNLWAPHDDGSLRNGTEFVFSNPYRGASLVKALEDIQEFFNYYEKNNKDLTISDRCSVHVHVDVREYVPARLVNLLGWYILVERVLFKYISPDRAKNSYCRPLTDSDFIGTISSKLYKSLNSSNDYDSVAYFIDSIRASCDKYSALNLLPSRSFGSIEFRHHQGTKDTKEILDWVNILLALVTWADNNDIVDFISRTKKDNISITILKNIFFNTKMEQLFKENSEVYSDLPFLLSLGLTDCYSFVNLSNLSTALENNRSLLTFCSPKRASTIFYKFKKANDYIKSTGV